MNLKGDTMALCFPLVTFNGGGIDGRTSTHFLGQLFKEPRPSKY